jgi:hypothetical protein
MHLLKTALLFSKGGEFETLSPLRVPPSLWPCPPQSGPALWGAHLCGHGDHDARVPALGLGPQQRLRVFLQLLVARLKVVRAARAGLLAVRRGLPPGHALQHA